MSKVTIVVELDGMTYTYAPPERMPAGPREALDTLNAGHAWLRTLLLLQITGRQHPAELRNDDH